MKTLHLPANIVWLMAALLPLSISPVIAQQPAKATVLAIAQDGTQLKAPALLQVGVHALEADTPKFLIGLKNQDGDWVTIRLKDRQGRNIHHPIFCYRKSLVATFDMSHVAEGTYLMEVASKRETYRYRIQVASKVVRSLDIKPTMLAKMKR